MSLDLFAAAGAPSTTVWVQTANGMRETTLPRPPGVEPAVTYQTIPLVGGWGGSLLAGAKSGWIHVWMDLTRAGWTNGATIATLPAGARPTHRLVTVIPSRSSAPKAMAVAADPSGVITAIGNGNQSDAGLVGHFAFPVL